VPHNSQKRWCRVFTPHVMRSNFCCLNWYRSNIILLISVEMIYDRRCISAIIVAHTGVHVYTYIEKIECLFWYKHNWLSVNYCASFCGIHPCINTCTINFTHCWLVAIGLSKLKLWDLPVRNESTCEQGGMCETIYCKQQIFRSIKVLQYILILHAQEMPWQIAFWKSMTTAKIFSTEDLLFTV